MLRDKCVNFEVAKLLKEKNVIIPSYSSYNSTGYFINKWHEINFESDKESVYQLDLTSPNVNESEYFYDAPTQSLLTQWLNDEKRIYIDILTDCTTEPKFCFEINKFVGDTNDLSLIEWGWKNIKNQHQLYYSKEDALNDAFIEAFKLLELPDINIITIDDEPWAIEAYNNLQKNINLHYNK